MKRSSSNTTTTITATADTIGSTCEAHRAAVANLKAMQRKYVEADAAQRALFARFPDPDFLDQRYPLDAEILRLRKAIVESEFDVSTTRFRWAGALDADEVKAGDADAVCMATIVPKLRALAVRAQNGGDFEGINRAAKVLFKSYEAANESRDGRRLAVGKPEPLTINPHQTWGVLFELARCETSGQPVTADRVMMAGAGYIDPALSNLSVEDAVERFLAPRPPRFPKERIAKLDADLDELSRRAFDVHEQRARDAEERAALAVQERQAREREARQDAVRAAEQVRERDAREAAVREQRAKAEAFVEAERAKRAAAER